MTRRTVHKPRRAALPAKLGQAQRRLEAALDARARLLADPQTTVCRVLNGAADGFDGLVIEKLGDVLVAQLHEGRLALPVSAARQLCERIRRQLNARAVYAKFFGRDRAAAARDTDARQRDPVPWLGEPVEAELAVLENGIRFLVRPYEGYSVGLFLEHRANRPRVRRLAAGRRVLNAFAYTGGFSVAAALGGAAGTVSIDVSKRFLEWGKRNFAANGLDPDSHTFICSDIFDYYRRARRQRRRFDLIILDPPTFARLRRPKRTFAIAEDLDRLVAGAVELLDPDGHLLLATNHRGTPRRRLERSVAEACASRGWEVIERPRLPADFRGDPDYAKSVLVRVG